MSSGLSSTKVSPLLSMRERLCDCLAPDAAAGGGDGGGVVAVVVF